MFEALSKARSEVLPSRYWIELNKKNLRQLEESGYENFKRTLALNYFTSFARPFSETIRFLIQNLPPFSVIQAFFRTIVLKKHRGFSVPESLSYNFLTCLLWNFVLRNDPDRLLQRLDEPLEGNPPRLRLGGRLISQDLANSVLEYYSIRSGSRNETIGSVMELGAGYGRTAFVFLSLIPGLKYIVVDIPPALYISERYLTSQFPNKPAHRFREFHSYHEIQESFERAELVFLLPHQLDLLPDKVVDLFINISSLHEMRMDQIIHYFACIDRLARKWFYFKQWKESLIPFENVMIRERDYPIPKHWSLEFRRDCKIQAGFFEALFRVHKGSGE